MYNEAQEKEIVIGTDVFEDNNLTDSNTKVEEYWYELGVVPNEVNSRGFRYTTFHLDLIHKWLIDVVYGKMVEFAYVPLHLTSFPDDSTLNLEKMCARITGFEVIDGKTWIRVVPIGPLSDLFIAHNERLKIVSYMVGSVKEVDGINTVAEDAQMLYFFLTEK